jgi:cytochrome b6-f complex iron-sulfur subunit
MKHQRPKAVSAEIELPASADAGISRRRFFGVLWGALGLAAIAELVWVAASFLRPATPPAADARKDAVIPAGAVESFAAGSVTAFQRGQFYLVRLDSGGFLAVSCTCTHLGCTVPWVEKEKKFLCPCHASAFDVTGSVISAPAPRALDLFPVSIENAVVKVDTSRRIKRNGFEPGQVVHPARK